MNKKGRILALVTGLFFATSITSYAKLPIDYDYFTINGKRQKVAIADLLIDGKPINKSTSGAVPLTINSRTIVPVRALSERLGYHVTWLESAQRVTIEYSGKKIELFIGSTTVKSNGKNVKINDGVAPIIIDSSTYVPIRFVVENMGLDINYDAKKNQISLNSSEKIVSNDINNLLFDTKNNAVSDPSIPIDVDKFTVNQPIAPIKPVEPVVDKVAEQKALEGKIAREKAEKLAKEKAEQEAKALADKLAKEKAQLDAQNAISNTLISQINKENNETFTITQSGGNLDINYFYLTSPKKLVVDIKNAKIDISEQLKKNLGGITFKSLDSLYHNDGNYTRYAVVLGDYVNTNDIKLSVNGNVFKAEKMPAKELYTQQGSAFSYAFDRASGSMTINAKSNIELQNTSYESNKIQFRIPQNAINLNVGNLGISNRIIKSAKVSQDGGNYIIDVELSDRVTYTITPNSQKSYKINFVKNNRSVPVIVLDAGHGGKDSGAVNTEFGSTEKGLNLQIINKLKPKLENAGYVVVLTRSDDTFIPLNDIASISNANDPDIFISVHHNSSPNSSAHGIETFYYSSAQSKNLANVIRKHLINNSGAFDRGSKDMGFVVIKRTTSPATLLELGFMSNRAEVQKNMSDSYQEILTDAIVSGVDEYFGR